MNAMTTLDWVGLGLWLLSWAAYGVWSTRASERQPSLMGTVAQSRRAWMREAYRRENRVTDSALISSLMHSATFFSSTTILILGALFAILGGIERNTDLLDVVKSLPMARQASQHLLEMKALCLAGVFVYGFLRFTMSLRQFNLIAILIGALPAERQEPAEAQPMVAKAARLNELAGNNFTHGLRAYYFAVPLVLWLVNPWLLLAGTAVITWVTYYMEFHSATVRALSVPDGPAP